MSKEEQEVKPLADVTSNKYYSQRRSSNEISRYDIQYETIKTPECHLSIVDEQYMKEVTICEEFTEIISLNVGASDSDKLDLRNRKLKKRGQRHHSKKRNSLKPVSKSVRPETNSVSSITADTLYQSSDFATEVIKGENYYCERNIPFPDSDISTNVNMSQVTDSKNTKNIHNVKFETSQQGPSRLSSYERDRLESEEVEMQLLENPIELVELPIEEEDEEEVEENETDNSYDKKTDSDEKKKLLSSTQKYTPEEEKILEILREVVRKCTVSDASKRPTASEVMTILTGR